MTDDEITECKEFAITVFTIDMIAEQAPTDEIATELIFLALSYGPPKNITTD